MSYTENRKLKAQRKLGKIKVRDDMLLWGDCVYIYRFIYFDKSEQKLHETV